MNNGSTFKSRREMYRKNVESGEKLRVVRAELAHDEGTAPGVAIYRGNFMLFCLTSEHAWKLADQLADALDGQGQ